MVDDFELEADEIWHDYDPFEEHDHGEELCMACFTYTRVCPHCHEGLMHSNLLTVDEETMIEYLCDSCAYYHADNYEEKMI